MNPLKLNLSLGVFMMMVTMGVMMIGKFFTRH